MGRGEGHVHGARVLAATAPLSAPSRGAGGAVQAPAISPATGGRSGPTTTSNSDGATKTGPRLALRDVLAQASTGNPDLRRQQVAIAVANANVLAAEGAFDFVLTGDGTFARRFSPRVSSTQVGAAFTRTFTGNLALSRPLESGGQVSLGAQDVITTSAFQICTPTQTNAICPFAGDLTYYTSTLNLTFTQPLLRGFGSEVTTANLRKQRIQRDVELLNRQAGAAVVLRDVVTAYWELGYAADDLEIRHSAVTLAEQQRAYTQAQVDVGRLGQADLAAVDRAIADRQQEVALAEQTLLVRSLDLQRLIGREVPADFASAIPLAAERPSSSEAAQLDAAAETSHALQSSPQLRALRTGVALSEIDVRTAQALLRPRLDFTGTVGTSGAQFAFGEAWSQAARLENIVWSAGLAFQLPLQNRAARGAEQVARATGTSVRIDMADLELGIRDGVVRMTGAARTAARRRDLAQAAVGYARTNLDAEHARFDVGRSTNNDVLLRQQELKNAEVQIARAAADLANAETALSALTGEILDHYGVVLRGS